MSTGQIMLWAWQLLQAVKFLHLQCIPVHGYVSASLHDSLSMKTSFGYDYESKRFCRSVGLGISHRDISLENVLLSGGDVRLMDFGQAVQTHLETGPASRLMAACKN